MICLSIGRNDVDTIIGEVEKQRGLELVEIRLDFLKPLDPDTVRKASRILHNMGLKVILTLRGEYSYREREELLLSAREWTEYIDVDLNEEGRDEIIKKAGENGVKVIVSCHNNRETPDLEEIISVLEKEKALGADVCKYVSTARGMEDNLRALKANLLFNHPKTVFCMGVKGTVSRVLAPLFGAEWTYSGVDGTAPGQLSFKETQNVLEILKEKK